MMEPHEFKWGWDAQKKRVHHWPSSERARRTHRDDLASLMGRDVSVRDGDVMGHGTYLPEERTDDGNIVAPPTVLLRATYNSEVPLDVIHHFENVYPATEVRRGHKHEHPPTHHEASSWAPAPSGAAWAREHFRRSPEPREGLTLALSSPPAMWREAAADMDGAMIALFIPEEVGKKIQVTGGEPLDLMHITLCYFEDKAADRDDWDKALDVVEDVIKKHGPLEGKIGGYGVFSQGKGDVLWASPDVPGLAELRHELKEALELEGFDLNEEHGWTPHITLKYDWEGKFPEMDEPIEVKFEEVTLARGEDKQHKSIKTAAGGAWYHGTTNKRFKPGDWVLPGDKVQMGGNRIWNPNHPDYAGRPMEDGTTIQIGEVVWITSDPEEAKHWADHSIMKSLPSEIRNTGAGGAAVYEVEPVNIRYPAESHAANEGAIEAVCDKARVVREISFESYTDPAYCDGCGASENLALYQNPDGGYDDLLCPNCAAEYANEGWTGERISKRRVANMDMWRYLVYSGLGGEMYREADGNREVFGDLIKNRLAQTFREQEMTPEEVEQLLDYVFETFTDAIEEEQWSEANPEPDENSTAEEFARWWVNYYCRNYPSDHIPIIYEQRDHGIIPRMMKQFGLSEEVAKHIVDAAVAEAGNGA